LARLNWSAANNRRRIRDQGAETGAGATFGGNRPPASASASSPPAAPERSTSRREPQLPEPLEWRLWKNRQRRDAIVVSIASYEGKTLAGIRLYTTGQDGCMRPTVKGVSVLVARLPELAAAVNKALAKARELRLIDDQDGADGPSEPGEAAE
jgi:Transcriptional Coactivator p15 (PC4)